MQGLGAFGGAPGGGEEVLAHPGRHGQGVEVGLAFGLFAFALRGDGGWDVAGRAGAGVAPFVRVGAVDHRAGCGGLWVGEDREPWPGHRLLGVDPVAVSVE